MPGSDKKMVMLYASRVLLSVPLLVLFAYTAPFLATALNPIIVLLFISVPFISRLLSERRKMAFFFFVEMVFMVSVLWLVFGFAGGSYSDRAIAVYSVILSAQFSMPFVFAVEILRSERPFSSITSFLLGMGVVLDVVATVAYSQLHSLPVVNSYVDVWSLQLAGTVSLFESGYQNGLPLQSLQIAISPLMLALFVVAAAGFLLLLMGNEGEIIPVRFEQAATQLLVGAAATLGVMALVLVSTGAGLTLTVIAASVLIVFLTVVRIARKTMHGAG